MKLATCLNIVLLVEYVISRCPPSDYYPIPSFGENCRYRCHCAADVQCNNVTGDCPGPCARGWMGPACQYRNVALNATNVIQNGVNVNPEAVNDGNLTTCSDLKPSDNSNEYFWRIELSRPFYIVGIIVHTLSGAQSTAVRIETSDVMNFSIGNQTCVQSYTIVENGRTEVICRQPVVARALQFVNQGNRSTMSLCELEIYGGRHVSFNKNTSQESTIYYDNVNWYSRLAVDGTDAWNGSHGFTCSATKQNARNKWWKLNLGTTYIIEDVYIFSRRDNPSQTNGFTLTIGENNTYQDTPTNSPSDYLPWTLDLEQPVTGNTVKLNRSVILTLCEVIVYAECLPGWCGWECSDICMCNTPHTGSPRLGAVCSFGCQDGWSGTNGRCDKVCNEGWLGQNCSVKCENCNGGAVNCDRVTGVCSKGCLPGYNNSFVTCVQACNDRWFGQDCSVIHFVCENCQREGVNCNHVTRKCSNGCLTGYSNNDVTCVQSCNEGWFGQNCSAKCGNCQGGGVNCYHVTGMCSKGCLPGYNNSDATCVQECNDGWFGQNCSAKCGHCQDGGVNCNPMTGVCSKGCLPGYNSSDVTCVQACKSGWFGQNCSEKCGNCQGGGSNCNHVTGVCSKGCVPGYNNSDTTCVQECNDGWFGQNCSAKCGNCQGREVNCHHKTGVCSKGCLPGYNSSDVTCWLACINGWFGQNYSAKCGNCKGGGVNCNHVTGLYSRGCLPGYNSSDVTVVKACSPGWFGQNCSVECGNCQGDGTNCDHVSGVCTEGCQPGYNHSDVTCMQTCSPGWFDQNCSVECGNCQGGGANCDHVSGVCAEGCQPGYNHSDVTCIEKCDKGSFGSNCNETCGACAQTHCHPVNGTCLAGCIKGYDGTTCRLKMEPLSGSNHKALVGGTVTVALFILITTLAVLLFLKRRRQRKSSSDRVELSASPQRHDAVKLDVDESEEYANCMVDDLQPEDDPRTIAVTDLRHFVKNISQAHGKLAEDYADIPRLFDLPRLAGQKENNIPKNKYKDIIPYDSNRVKLPEIPDQEDSDYINASFILSTVGGRNYIASQGPTQRTLVDFWRMVWEESVGVIVILTNCFELGKVKCVQYWPDTDELTFGDLEVTLLSQKVFNEYTIRCLRCKKVGQDNGHDVMQFHFSAWPDKQVPETALSLVNFWRQVRTSDTDGFLPWLVHCSAGIGRTGTFISLDALYEIGRRNNKVNVYDYVTELRHQRQMMVQTVDQYVFLHLAVAEALVPIGTVCTAEAFPEHLASLTASNPGQASQLQIEYEAVKSMTEEDCPDTEYGNLPIGTDLERCAQSFLKENRDKSRDAQIVPPDEFRPRLGCHVDNRNNYINAVNIPTYRLGGGLMLTQVPLPNTVVDFLRLLFTYNVKFVVLLESDVPQDCQFWPRAGYSTTFGPFTVIHVGESFYQYHTCRDLECLYKNKSIDVTVLQYTGTWQNDVMCPVEHESFQEIVSVVDSTTDPSILSKPIVVQCMDGNEKSGLFAALYTIIERIKCTGDVSIAENVLRIRGRRRQAICSLEQYQFLHNATMNYIDSLQVYANI